MGPERARNGIVAAPPGMAPCREAFLRTLEGRKLSPQTVRAYGSDLAHLAAWLEGSYPAGIAVDEVQASDIEEYLATLARYEAAIRSPDNYAAAVARYEAARGG